MRTSGFGTYLCGVLDLITTLTLSMFPPSIYPSRKGNGRPVRFFFTANGTTRTLLYYFVDGIHPRFAFFVSPFPDPTTEVEVTFIRLQEALRRDARRLRRPRRPGAGGVLLDCDARRRVHWRFADG